MHMVFTFMITLQKFREIRRQPKFRTLTKYHTESRRGRRIIKYKAMGATEVPLERGVTEIVCNSISNLYVKRLSQGYQEAVHYTSVAPCAIATSVTLPLPPSSP